MAIGIGTWKCKVDTMFFKGEVLLTIGTDDAGEYNFDLKMDQAIPAFEIMNIKEDPETNSLSAIATVEMLPGKEINVTCTFTGDTFTGVLKVPFLGKIKLEDGVRVS